MKKLRELIYNKEFGGHPHHQHHHHDHGKLIEEEKQAMISKEIIKNPKILPTFADNEKPESNKEDKGQKELLNQHLKVIINNKTATTKLDHQTHLEQNHKTTKTFKEQSKQDEAIISKDESVVADKEVIVPNTEEETAAIKAIELDSLLKETSKATTHKPQESTKVKDQEPQSITDKEEAIAEMQRDASYIQFKIPEHDLVIQKRQHGKHKKHHKKHHHHKHHHHHHVSKRDADEDIALRNNASKSMSDNSKEETNYLVEGDKKLDLIVEKKLKSDEVYKEIKQELKSHTIEKINIINNYRPVQPLNDRIVLRSFPSFDDVLLTSYQVPNRQQPNHVHSKTEMVRSSATKICLALFINLIVNLLRLA